MRTLSVKRTTDERGFPVVSWEEPRAEPGFFWRKSFWRHMKVFVAINADEVYLMQRMDKESGVQEHLVGVPFDTVTGFSIRSSSELYRDGDAPLPHRNAKQDDYRDELVLIAELNRPSRGGTMFLPLTLTTATHAEVTNLHGVLTQEFIANRRALTTKIEERQKVLRREQSSKQGEESKARYLKPSFKHGGRRYVGLIHNAEEFKKAPELRESYSKFSLYAVDDTVKPAALANPSQPHVGVKSVIMTGGDGLKVWLSSGAVRLVTIRTVDKSEVTARFIGMRFEKDTGTWDSFKLPEDLSRFTIASCGDINVPQTYLLAQNMIADRSVSMVLAEFKDGEILPVCFGFTHEVAYLEAIKEKLTEIFLQGGAVPSAGDGRRPRL